MNLLKAFESKNGASLKLVIEQEKEVLTEKPVEDNSTGSVSIKRRKPYKESEPTNE